MRIFAYCYILYSIVQEHVIHTTGVLIHVYACHRTVMCAVCLPVPGTGRLSK